MSEGEDVNPVQGVARWRLAAKAAILRSAASLAFTLSNYTAPVPPSPTQTVWLDSTISHWRESKAIRVYVWDPAIGKDKRKRRALINFHGGGFLLGSGTDDGRWVAAVQDTADTVVFSVEYRLAPGYPYPTPVEDCVDAILQIRERAEDFGIDPDNIILSGFSAGATLALSSWVILQDPVRWGYQITRPLPSPGDGHGFIAGMVLFYPVLDWTISRTEKRERSAKPGETLSSSMTDLFDASYIHPYIPHAQRLDPRLSPGLMPPEMVGKLPPIHLCLCEHDMLLAEGLQFADKVKEAGRVITSRIVPGQKHAWDKAPLFSAIHSSVAVEYEAAIVAMRHWLNGEAANLNAKDVSQIDDTVEMQVDLPV
ncbi:hypothetical protein ACRALDRAFT_2094977 [Sodiomyces alcalophilus JCM 7366]|uniref:uncharacterized protein n=1 Tax=Sodiomyces alcalophilus JCM 7366 TaxID=591952 RepID=UPI0039B65CF2